MASLSSLVPTLLLGQEECALWNRDRFAKSAEIVEKDGLES